MAQSDERKVVKTYVPAFQKEVWEEQAASLDMTQSEFVRTMVQAGRRDFEFDPEEDPSSASDPQGLGLEERVLNSLKEDEPLTWDDLLEASEEWLDEALTDLQDRNQVTHDGREGGYVLQDQ